MSFAENQITLPGSSENTRPLKECSRCATHKEPSGGVELSKGKWVCAACWVRRVAKA
jgi:hypothetical protein